MNSKTIIFNLECLRDSFTDNNFKTILNNAINYINEKDKIINEILNDSWYTEECPIELSDFAKDDEKTFNCENCQDDYKKCWLKYFENKVLERSKNGK